MRVFLDGISGLIDCLIFSKDRPAQLDLLLRSIEKHAPNLYRTLTVLWTTSTQPSALDEYSRGYSACIHEHTSRRTIGFQSERGIPDFTFEDYVRGWLDNVGEVVSFLVDDDVFYRDAAEPDVLPWSFRGGDYDYPFSLDGNVYAALDIEKLLDGLTFSDPTELEHQGHLHRDRLPFAEVNHGAPCLVGIPANRVSKSSGMPHMGQHEYDLNEHYLAGERLALPDVHGVPPAHAEIPLVFA